ncbi:MAG: D-glycero-beta-D-manno-heptose 1,7-bisphosphate 7-phosphatase [Sulfurovum sp.]|nr:D-glycero-beta-D-manno-heptose 1,7-bisphosphate 7-phosphatase [Sulfurovum sp.]
MKKNALFLDRDGIINVDHGYVSKIKDFEFMEGIFDFVKLFSDAGYLVFIVTNQSGIGRGYYTQEDFNTLTQWMVEKFEAQNVRIAQVYHCPHSPEENCHCRKPNTGMIEQAMETYEIDLSHSWMVGDKQSDIDLALNAGIGHSIYIGDKRIDQASLSFETIVQAKQYFQENTGKIRDIRASKV